MLTEPLSVSITSELIGDFLAYSTAIYNRALPDIVDGLKSAQRRVIVGLDDLNLASDGQYCKVSRLEGHALGRYHPQGGCAGTIINLGQHGSVRYTLTDIHGNCGGSIQEGTAVGQLISEDPPAAARYLEVRATPLCEQIYLSQIRKGLGNWRPNYDGTTNEPIRIVPVLPALLLTGAQGIASGYACHHISYNMRDVINATCAWIRDKKITEAKFLTKFANPPEPPQGGRIIKDEKISDIITAGSGQVTAYGEWEKDNKLKWGKRSTRPALIITRLASGSSERFLEKVRDLAEAEKLPGLLDAADYSSRDGIRIVLVTKTEENRDNALSVLLTSNTGLKHTHNVNCVAVGLDGKPVTVGAREAIESWYGERVRYLIALYTLEIEKLEEKYARCEAVLRILSDLDKFLKLVREGKDRETVLAKVAKTWKLSPDLAKYVISIPISTLIATESGKVRNEADDLRSRINTLEPLCHEGGDLDLHICDQIASLRPLCGPTRAVWMSESVRETKVSKPAVQGERERIIEEGKALGLTARAINKWLKENLGTGKLKEKWEEYKAEYAHRLQMTTREGKKQRKELLDSMRSLAESRGMPKRGKWAWNAFIATCESDRIDTIRAKLETWLGNLPRANSRPDSSVPRATQSRTSGGGEEAGNKQSPRTQRAKRRTGSRKPRSRDA
jgi:DNA gyrase subunit A